MKYASKKEYIGGFTLIELLVALSLFTIVMTVAIGSLFTIISANKRARAIQINLDNLHFAIDEMSRDIRTGTDYSYSGASGNACGNSFTFSFESSEGEDIEYRCSGGSIQKDIDSSGWVSMTAPEITVTNFRIYDISESDSPSQPRALVLIAGSAEAESGVTTEFSLQTTVSQRRLEIN